MGNYDELGIILTEDGPDPLKHSSESHFSAVNNHQLGDNPVFYTQLTLTSPLSINPI